MPEQKHDMPSEREFGVHPHHPIKDVLSDSKRRFQKWISPDDDDRNRLSGWLRRKIDLISARKEESLTPDWLERQHNEINDAIEAGKTTEAEAALYLGRIEDKIKAEGTGTDQARTLTESRGAGEGTPTAPEGIERKTPTEWEEEWRELTREALLNRPELRTGLGMARPKDVNQLPTVYLSQRLTVLREIAMPQKISLREGGVAYQVYSVKTLPQAVKATLEEIHEGVLQSQLFSEYRSSRIDHYLSLVKSLVGEESQIYKDLVQLKEATTIFHDVLHTNILVGKGAKKAGVEELARAVSEKLDDKRIWTLLQDPEIEAAVHRIQGDVTAVDWFIEGRDDKGIQGGSRGSVEKLGYGIALIEGLRNFDGPGQFSDLSPGEVAGADYTAYVIRYLLDYFSKRPDQYENYLRLCSPTCVCQANHELLTVRGEKPPAELLQEGSKFLRYSFGIVPFPSALHAPNQMTEFILSNFEEERLGWENLARMLTIYGEHDPRYQEYQSHRDGYFKLEEWFFADTQQQKAMYTHALMEFGRLSPSDQRLIIRNNLLRMYDWGEVSDKGKNRGNIVWHTKALLDFDAVDENGRFIVDIGSLNPQEFNNILSGNHLNNYYVYEGYAYSTFGVWNDLCQSDTAHQRSRLKDLVRITTAEEGYRHLTETKADPQSRVVAALAERQRQIEHLFRIFSEQWNVAVWSDRSRGRRDPGREPLGWETHVNEYIRLGFDKDRYRQEFESIGAFGVDWTSTESLLHLTIQERLAKIIGKYEHKDVWITYLKNKGLDKEISRILFGNQDVVNTPEGQQQLLQYAQDHHLLAQLEQNEGRGRTWKFYQGRVDSNGYIQPGEVSEVILGQLTDAQKTAGLRQATDEQKAEIILNELTYRALVAFVGFKIQEEFLDYDFYGNPVWRTWFDNDFDRKTNRGRGKGRWRQDYFDDQSWKRINVFLVGDERRAGVFTDEFSPFYNILEKFEEDRIIWCLADEHWRQTYDLDRENYVFQQWGQRRNEKKGWDMLCSHLRDLRYTVGDLRGRFVHSQLAIEFDKDTGLSLFENPLNPKQIIKGRIEKDQQNKNKDVMIISNPQTGHEVILKIDEYTHLPIITDPNAYRFRLVHSADNAGEPETPVVGFDHPLLAGYDRASSYALGTEGVFTTRGQNKGMGLAGLEKQLTWEPLFYDKKVRLRFFKARYMDVRYQWEVARNTRQEWEGSKAYYWTADEKQRKEFYDELLKVETDTAFIESEMRRDDVDESLVREYEKRKRRLLIRDVKGEAEKLPDEDSLINLKQIAISVTGIKGIPGLRSWTEFGHFARGTAVGLTPAAYIWSRMLSGVSFGYGLGFVASLGFSFWFGLQMIDKGMDKQGNEQAGAIATLLGTGGGTNLGMIGQRRKNRNPRHIARAWNPVFDSALPMEALVTYWFKEARDRLERIKTSF